MEHLFDDLSAHESLFGPLRTVLLGAVVVGQGFQSSAGALAHESQDARFTLGPNRYAQLITSRLSWPVPKVRVRTLDTNLEL